MIGANSAVFAVARAMCGGTDGIAGKCCGFRSTEPDDGNPIEAAMRGALRLIGAMVAASMENLFPSRVSVAGIVASEPKGTSSMVSFARNRARPCETPRPNANRLPMAAALRRVMDAPSIAWHASRKPHRPAIPMRPRTPGVRQSEG
jgi:hypothetical protein